MFHQKRKVRYYVTFKLVAQRLKVNIYWEWEVTYNPYACIKS